MITDCRTRSRGGKEVRKRRERKKGWKSGPSFFEEEGELGNDIKMAVNRIEYSRVENDIGEQGPILKIHLFPPPITKIPMGLFSVFYFSPHPPSPPGRVHCRRGGRVEEEQGSASRSIGGTPGYYR